MINQLKNQAWPAYVSLKTFLLRPLKSRPLKGMRRIVVYHEISEGDIATFTKQIEYFAANYKIVPLSQWVKSLDKSDENILSISFDDAFASVYERAAPILDRYNIKPCVFVPVGFIESYNPEEYIHRNLLARIEDKPMTWEQLRNLSKRGYEIGSHSWSHANCGDEKIDFDYELGKSRIKLEEKVGSTIKFLAFPFGRKVNICQKAIDASKGAGYNKVFSAIKGEVRADDFLFPRIYMNQKWDVWTVECMLKGYFDRII